MDWPTWAMDENGKEIYYRHFFCFLYGVHRGSSLNIFKSLVFRQSKQNKTGPKAKKQKTPTAQVVGSLHA